MCSGWPRPWSLLGGQGSWLNQKSVQLDGGRYGIWGTTWEIGRCVQKNTAAIASCPLPKTKKEDQRAGGRFVLAGKGGLTSRVHKPEADQMRNVVPHCGIGVSGNLVGGQAPGLSQAVGICSRGGLFSLLRLRGGAAASRGSAREAEVQVEVIRLMSSLPFLMSPGTRDRREVWSQMKS